MSKYHKELLNVIKSINCRLTEIKNILLVGTPYNRHTKWIVKDNKATIKLYDESGIPTEEYDFKLEEDDGYVSDKDAIMST